tara:strand:+ start:74 stop:376 length:303 start_codon:yes stop_codon:yes gene_type:complete
MATYHKKSFKPKAVMKEEYTELVKFCDGLLIDDFNQTKQINELKTKNLKLIQAVDILNKTLKEKDNKSNAEAYREGRKNFMEDMVSEFPEMEHKIINIIF